MSRAGIWGLLTCVMVLWPVQAKTVTVAAGSWEGMTAADGSGLYFQVIREALAETDSELKFRVVNWKRAKQMFYANRADLLLADYKSTGNRQFFPQWHIDMDPPVVLFSLKPIADFSELHEKAVGWILGYDFGQFLPVSVEGVEVSAEQFGFDMLEYGRLDAYVSYDSKVPPALRARLHRYPLTPAQRLFPVFQNTFAGRQLAEDYDRGMLRLFQSGRLQQIYADQYKEIGFPAAQR